ncbi:MAG: GNAT family N-acetyltransferase [Betaproteobacteria bacterium]|nr:GNAT family N-acetyltransferase [Betaproteobacteria bacterium]
MTKPLDPVLLDVPDELVGPRIVLRAWREEDAGALWLAVEASRAHLAPWMPWVRDHDSAEFSRAYTRRMRAKWALREDLPMGIWTRAGHQLIGATGLHRFDWTVPAMDIGYWLTPDATGHGYASEAVRLVTAMAFDHLRAERVTITCSTANTRSAAVPLRCGYLHEATLRSERRDHEGRLRDTLLYAMTRRDYLARVAAPSTAGR